MKPSWKPVPQGSKQPQYYLICSSVTRTMGQMPPQQVTDDAELGAVVNIPGCSPSEGPQQGAEIGREELSEI